MYIPRSPVTESLLPPYLANIKVHPSQSTSNPKSSPSNRPIHHVEIITPPPPPLPYSTPSPNPPKYLPHRPHHHLNHNKRPRTHRQRPHARGANPLPKSPRPFRPPRLPPHVPHVGIPHPAGAEAIGLHLAFDDVEGVRGQPEGFARDAAVEGDEGCGDGGAWGGGPLRVEAH